ncbi:MAG: Rieske 2Fe-2S domain-containing protein [Azonexus sp.]|jgi:nitrite reductase/ring-hydroxylating ferredoxin subunit|nr:Rieske 2Fe-2S domain-containing protein [Azonexus sp.]
MNQPPRFPVCASAALAERQYIKLSLSFEKRPEECLLFRHAGQAYAYINRCVHMPRRLDCERQDIFDESGRFLRCSMHGIVYTPDTGTSISAMCEGQQLRAVDIYEENGEVGIADFRVSDIQR